MAAAVWAMTAAAAFVATHVDDLVVLVVFFATAQAGAPGGPRTWHVVVGQTLGFTALLALSAQGLAANAMFPRPVVGLLGLLPLALGVRRLPDAARALHRSATDKKDDGDDDAASVPVPPKPTRTTSHRGRRRTPAPTTLAAALAAAAPHVAQVALTTLSNGSDNVSVYVPLLSRVSGSAEAVVTVLVMYVMLAAWLAAAHAVVRAPPVARLLDRWGDVAVPLLLLGLGMYVLVSAGTVCVGRGCADHEGALVALGRLT
jgi:cadmium resistance protein CadD (predicted permease)